MKFAAMLLICANALFAQSNTYVLKAARLFDGASGQIVAPGVVVVSDGKIQSVGSANAPAGATVIDLGDATLLPGFIDAHTHLSDEFNPDYNGSRPARFAAAHLRACDSRHRQRAQDRDGGFHHGARRGIGPLHRRRAAQRDQCRVSFPARECWFRCMRWDPPAAIAMTATAFDSACSAMRPAPKTASSIRPTRPATPCGSISSTARM